MSLFKPNDIFAGRYELNGLTGKGELSEVWKARDRMADGALVSLKIFASDKKPTEEAVRRFRRQFSVSQSVTHPHLLKVSYYDIWEGLPYLVMPFCPGGSLARFRQKNGFLSERQMALILCQAASALEALLHKEPPLLHGNVKPENILSTQEDYFLLSDLGQSKESGSSLAGSSPVPGRASAAYAPPERFDQFRHTDASADIFSLGVTLYEAATKMLPWAGKGGQALLTGEKVPVLPKPYSSELNELLQACMSANKNQRPNAQELHLRGKHFLETGSWNLPKEDGKDRKGLKNRTPWIMAAAVFGLLIAGAFWAVQNQYLSIPTAGLQNERGSDLGEQEQDIDEMLIATLEAQLAEMTSKAIELEEENRQLKQNGASGEVQAGTSVLVMQEKQKPAPAKQEMAPAKEASGETKKAAPKNVVSHSAPPARAEKKLPVQNDLEKQLNKISDPAVSGKTREAWKNEMLTRFSEGNVRILDVTDGTPKQFSTRIFMNMLYKVPHTVVVKEVKRDQNQKIWELRLELQPKG